MISEFFEKQIELERQQREGGGAAPRHGRRSSSRGGGAEQGWAGADDDGRWEPAPAPAGAGVADPGGEDDVAILMRFYADVEPEYANRAKVSKIIGVFQKKAAKTGADWREWMYNDMARKRGIDPREYVAAQGDTGGAAAPEPAGEADPRLALLGRRAGGQLAAAGGGPGADWDQQLRREKLAVGSVGGGPGRYHAARSHEMHAQYAQEWDAGYRALGGEGAPFAERLTGGAPGPAGGDALGQMVERSPNGQGAAPTVGRTVGSGAGAWRAGPRGGPLVLDASDRNLMAVSIRNGRGVAACADHGLHCFDLSSKTDVDGATSCARLTRQLHSKRFGHADWVSVVATLPDGRMLSGGQDSKLCLWNASGVVCKDLVGHTAAISALGVGANAALTASYDTTLRCWDLNTAAETACLRGHTAPVLDMAWSRGGLAISGDRSGVAMLW